MSLAALIAAIKANSSTLLALWVVFEQYLAANDKLKANSTLQMVSGVVRALLSSQKNP